MTCTTVPFFFQGSPQFVDLTVGNKKCIAVFEFVTRDACKGGNTEEEIPCSLYGSHDHKLRDLTPLIKLRGKQYYIVTTGTFFRTCTLGWHCNYCTL